MNASKKNSFKHNMAKKTDSDVKDEESQDLIESNAKQENAKRVDILEKQVTAIKSITLGLSG